jgi:hypothetical protein
VEGTVGPLRWSRTCEVLAVDPPHRIAWRTVTTSLFVDSTDWSLSLEPIPGGTRIVQTYLVTQCPRWWEWIAVRMVPRHIDRTAALTEDLRRLGAVAATDDDSSKGPMTTNRVVGSLIVVGSLVFLAGAAIGVPRVFTERDPDSRLRLLQAGSTRWLVAQPLYGLGPLIVATGVGVLAVNASTRGARTALTIAALCLVGGGLAWGWSLYLRATRVSDFAFGNCCLVARTFC